MDTKSSQGDIAFAVTTCGGTGSPQEAAPTCAEIAAAALRDVLAARCAARNERVVTKPAPREAS